jgi:cystathionine beta-synthase
MDARTDGEFASAIEGVGKGQPSRTFDPVVVDDVVQVAG